MRLFKIPFLVDLQSFFFFFFLSRDNFIFALVVKKLAEFAIVTKSNLK